MMKPNIRQFGTCFLMEMTVFNFGRQFTKISLLLNAARSMVVGWALQEKSKPLPWYPNEPNNGSDGRESVVQFGGVDVKSIQRRTSQNECDQDPFASVVLRMSFLSVKHHHTAPILLRVITAQFCHHCRM